MQEKDKGNRDLQKSSDAFGMVFFTNFFSNTMSFLNILLCNLTSQNISAAMTTQVMCGQWRNIDSH